MKKYFYVDAHARTIETFDEDDLHIDGNQIFPKKRGFYFDFLGKTYLNLKFDPIFADRSAAYNRALELCVEKQSELAAQIAKIQREVEQYEEWESFLRRSIGFHTLNDAGQIDGPPPVQLGEADF